MNESTQVAVNYAEIAVHLKKGLEQTIDAVERQPGGGPIANQLRASLSLIQQLQDWAVNLPAIRLRTILFSVIKSLDDILRRSVSAGKLAPEVYGATAEHPSAPFLVDTVLRIGPEVHVSQDQMTVRALIDKGFERYWNPDLIKAGLERLGFHGDLIEKNIDLLLRKPGRLFKVVTGKYPVPGTDAVIEDCLDLHPSTGVPAIQENGRANFKELDWIRSVKAGQIVLKKTPPTPGIPGLNVYGEPIPCRDGIDIPFPSIPNTVPGEDGLSLVSTVDGCAYKDGPRIIIAPILEIPGDVDYTTGNIRSAVSVHVRGNVLSGFTVESEQDILVQGTVEGSRIHARGNVFLPGGVQGKSEAHIQADHRVEAKFINAAWVCAGESLLVHGSVIQSFLRAPRIALIERNAEILGGLAEAADDLCADVIGSEIGVRTRIHLGYDLAEITQKIHTLKATLESLQDRRAKTAARITSLSDIEKKAGSLSPSQAAVLSKMKSNLAKLDKILVDKQKQCLQAEEALQKANAKVRMVRARKQIFPGAEIRIQEHTFVPTKPTGPATLVVSGDQIAVLPFQERHFEEKDEADE